MEKKLLLVFSLALTLCSFLWSCTDDGPKVPTNHSQASLLSDFLNSEYGIATLENHGLTIANLDLGNSTKEFFKSKGATAFAVPIIKNGQTTGVLNAFVIPGNDSYRAIVEEWESTSDREYNVSITTGNGAYLATVAVSHEGKRKTQEIIDIADYSEAGSNMNIRRVAQGNVVMTTRKPKESWWACTTRVYHSAKQACGNDSQCDFLCDIADLAKGCTISMAAAAARVCI